MEGGELFCERKYIVVGPQKSQERKWEISGVAYEFSIAFGLKSGIVLSIGNALLQKCSWWIDDINSVFCGL